MDPQTKQDYLWLLSDDAQPLLDQTAKDFRQQVNALTINKRLRKKTTPTRAALLIEQIQLRHRGKAKFDLADAMFFTRRAQEQSTSIRLSNYKASKFARLNSVADVCCGIGGDLIPLALRKADPNDDEATAAFSTGHHDRETVGLDSDELTTLFAQKNLAAVSAVNANVECDTFENFDTTRFEGIHFDPDRRVTNRTVRGDFFTPKLGEIFARTTEQQSIAIKVAPATPVDEGTDTQAELEWIGDNRECKQQVIWQGPATARPGCRTATYVTSSGNRHQFSCSSEQAQQKRRKPPATLGPAIYEPHPTVLAGKLVDALTRRYDLRPIDPMIDYLTGVPNERCPLLKTYRIDVELKLNLKLVFKELRARNIGKIVVKKRGVDQAVFEHLQSLKLTGDNQATVIATRHNGRRLALITNIQSKE